METGSQKNDGNIFPGPDIWAFCEKHGLCWCVGTNLNDQWEYMPFEKLRAERQRFLKFRPIASGEAVRDFRRAEIYDHVKKGELPPERCPTCGIIKREEYFLFGPSSDAAAGGEIERSRLAASRQSKVEG